MSQMSGVGQSSGIEHRQNIFGKGGTVNVDGVKYSYSGKITEKSKEVLKQFADCVRNNKFEGKIRLGDIKFSSISKGPFAKISGFVKKIFQKAGKNSAKEGKKEEIKQESTQKSSSIDSHTVQDRFCKREMENILKKFATDIQEWDADVSTLTKNTAEELSKYLDKNDKNFGEDSKSFLQDLKKLATGAGDGDANKIGLDRNRGSTSQLAQELSRTIGPKLGWQ